ncbi:MAG: aminotransferase class III-fold pyridoxal phosphate-dependent enzyme, partial [Bacteroidota bacterium]
FQHFGVVPDILTVAKAMGGGMPLGAFISSQEVFGVFRDNPPLSHVTTFGGHPVSCAAGHAALEVLLEEDLAARANDIGRIIRERLRHPQIVEVRGMGALLGMELSSRALTERLVNRCLEQGVLLGWTLHSNTLVRIAPPLNIEYELLDTALSVILRSLREVGRASGS